jgi:UDP-GlcNAc:undecaprenyl-phosphate GlcNAc-1-phosphate transferase
MLMAGIITAFSLFFLRRIAPKVGLIDLPGGRKQHAGEIPLVGGLGLFIGFLFTCLILPWPLSPYKPLFGCMTLILFLGLMDDLHELTPRLRLIGQMVIVLLAIFWGNVELKNLGDLFFSGNIYLSSWAAIIFTILAWLTFMNASNMQDGLDGLAGTINAVQVMALIVIAFMGHVEADSSLLIAFWASIMVFLFFNFPLLKNKRPAKIFMGDAGSLMLGFFTAWFAIRFSQAGFPSPVTFLWITAIPLLDFFAVTIGRLRRHDSPLKGDRNHLHHFLQHKGFDPCYIVICLGSLSILLSAIGYCLACSGFSDGVSFILFLCILIPYVLFFSKKRAPSQDYQGREEIKGI